MSNSNVLAQHSLHYLAPPETPKRLDTNSPSMSISLCFNPPIPHTKTHNFNRLVNPTNILSKRSNLYNTQRFPIIRCVHEDSEHHQHVKNPAKEKWETLLSTAASLYPVYVTVGGVVACLRPSTFSWFVNKAPTSYSLSLGLIMLAMGLTLELKDLINLFNQRPLSILFGCAAQYIIMPLLGMLIGKVLGLPSSISVGLILLACCPGGTASNVVTLLAQGDVPLSIVMTACTTLAAVILTPLLTKILAGTYVPVDAVQLSISTLQVVVAPILLGSYIQSVFPKIVKILNPFAPLVAVLMASLLACSVFSETMGHLKHLGLGASVSSELSPILHAQALLSSELGLAMLSVLLLHFAGFFVGYFSAAIAGFGEQQRRAISIEVGMQNSSLGVVLATCHFSSSPMVVLPAAVSAIIMNLMGSSLGFFWRYIDPSHSTDTAQP